MAALRLFNVGHPIMALWEYRAFITKKLIVVVVVDGHFRVVTRNAMAPIDCASCPKNPLSNVGACFNLLGYIAILVKISLKRMSDDSHCLSKFNRWFNWRLVCNHQCIVVWVQYPFTILFTEEISNVSRGYGNLESFLVVKTSQYLTLQVWALWLNAMGLPLAKPLDIV